MTDEQFKEIMDTLTNIRRALDQVESNTSDLDEIKTLLKDIKKSKKE